MCLPKNRAFAKSANCPQSNDLLAFQNGELSERERSRITLHISFCEFCESEIEFYSRFPQADDLVENVEIPVPLYELARALLTNKHNDYALLNNLLSETDEVRFQKL